MAPKKMTDAEKAKLKKMLSQGGNLDKPKAKKASTSYSPAPMSATAKAKAKAAGKKMSESTLKKNLKPLKSERKITATGSSSKVVSKTLKEGSMATNPKLTVDKKPSTSYSPKPFDTRAAAVKRGETKRKELTSNVVKAVSKTAKYTPMGVVAKGAVKAGRALGKVIPKK